MIKLLKECAEYIRLHPDNGLSEKLLSIYARIRIMGCLKSSLIK